MVPRLRAPGRLTHDGRMADRGDARVVYSTDRGRVCTGCGWPADNCQCSRARASAALPARITARLRLEKAGRGGKTVTVVAGLPLNAAFLKDLCSELKRACGTGGAIQEDAIELQGDLRDRVRSHLQSKGFIVKG